MDLVINMLCSRATTTSLPIRSGVLLLRGGEMEPVVE